jgi:hypothetical protein
MNTAQVLLPTIRRYSCQQYFVGVAHYYNDETAGATDFEKKKKCRF